VGDPVAARLPVRDQAHPGEVDLTLHPRIAVDDPHRRRGLAEPAALHAEPVQRPVRHHHPAPLQQHPDLDHRQTLVDPRPDLLLLGQQLPPGGAVALRLDRPHRRHHHTDHLVGDLLMPTRADHAGGLGRLHVASCGLPVHARLSGYGA
jgi:hypothetical protein